MKLAPFDPLRAPTVSSWARTADEVRAWCALDHVPVPADVIAAWGREDGVTALALIDRGRLVGYGELWVDTAEREVELARLIVAPDLRRRGIGRRLVTELTARARSLHPRVVLRVHPDNAAARRCYEASGFVRASPAEEEQWNRGQPVPYVWMTYAGAD